MTEGKNGRDFSRIVIPIEAKLSSDLGEMSGTVHDISISGLCMKVEKPLPDQTVCKITVLLGDDEPKLSIEATGEVLRSNEAGMAISFSSVDVESFPHLKSLILYNSHQSDEIIEECASHMGIHRS
ncbi:MAG: PilZ domain-containing protein [Mariprofundaceae bacterium]